LRCFAYGSTSGENQQGVIDLVTVLECRERVQRARDARLVAFDASAALAAGIAGLPGARLQPFEVVDEHEQVGGRAISVAKPSTPASPISGSACWRGARDRSAAPSARRRSRVHVYWDQATMLVQLGSLDPSAMNSASVQASKFLTVLSHRFRSRFTFASITSQIMAAMSGPPNCATCLMPVGEVRLISVR
jgi:hypothetical protein